MAIYVGLLVLSLLVFGGGILLGYLLFRSPPSISVTLPDTALAEPIESLQRTIYRFDRQLMDHVERMTQGADELKSAGITSAQFLKLLTANQEFEKQLTVFAADVRQARTDLVTVVPNGEDREGAPLAEPAAASPEHKLNQLADRKFRTEVRHPFLCKQWIAPYGGVRAPDSEEFFKVQCRDISSGGISFFMDRTPTFQTVVVRLSSLGEPKYLTAQIKRTVASMNPEHGRYIVGCKLVGALHPGALPAGLEESIQRREASRQGSDLAIAGPPCRY
jgi:hypothetical protein